jgi:hypothetical protein
MTDASHARSGDAHDDSEPAGSEMARCGSCRTTFYCGVRSVRCWCSDVALSQPERDRLQQRFPADACVCPRCITNAP